jgi:hypothetical protein
MAPITPPKVSGNQLRTVSELEAQYVQYMVPMPLDAWNRVADLSQPSSLKRVSIKTAYSSVE